MQFPLRFQTSVAFIIGYGSELVTLAFHTFYIFRRYPRNGDKFVTYLVTILQVVT